MFTCPYEGVVLTQEGGPLRVTGIPGQIKLHLDLWQHSVDEAYSKKISITGEMSARLGSVSPCMTSDIRANHRITTVPGEKVSRLLCRKLEGASYDDARPLLKGSSANAVYGAIDPMRQYRISQHYPAHL